MNTNQAIRAKALEIAVQIKGQNYALETYRQLATEIADYIRGYAIDESEVKLGDCDGLSEGDVSE